MDNRKDDSYYARKALGEIEKLQKYIENKTYEEFMADDELIDAIMFRFVQLAEHVKSLSEDFKTKNSHIPWGKIIGFRNGIVHEYGRTDYYIVYETITENLDSLKLTLTM